MKEHEVTVPKALKLFRQTSSDYTKLLGNVLSLETGMDFFTSAQLTLTATGGPSPQF